MTKCSIGKAYTTVQLKDASEHGWVKFSFTVLISLYRLNKLKILLTIHNLILLEHKQHFILVIDLSIGYQK